MWRSSASLQPQATEWSKLRIDPGHPAPNSSARRRLGLSQAELGTRLGVSRDAIWEWENGNHEPRPETRVAIDRLIEEALSEDEIVAMRIRSLRTGLGLTQRELATRLGVYPKTVSRWEQGRRRPSEEVISRIEKLLK